MSSFRMQWGDYGKQMERLRDLIRKSRRRYKSILAISKGGLPIGTYLANQLKLPLFTIPIQSYKGRKQSRRIKAGSPSGIGSLGEEVLVVDDIYDTGRTFKKVLNIVSSTSPETYICDIAVIVVRPEKRNDVQFSCISCSDWVIFPYEVK